MFEKDRETVFVIGAGASWHYGYPTGEVLVRDIVDCAKALDAYCAGRLSAEFNTHLLPSFFKELEIAPDSDYKVPWQMLQLMCSDLINRLERVQPLVIDYFIGWNTHLARLATMLIAGALLQRQCHDAGKKNYNQFLNFGNRTQEEFFPYHNYRDRWIRFVIHQLLLNCDASEKLPDNRVHFVTFNYDTSLELSLRESLAAVNFLHRDHIDQFLGGDRIIHIYGQLDHASQPGDIKKIDLQFGGRTSLSRSEQATAIFEQWLAASKSLKVMGPKEVGQSSKTARHLISNAKRLYFLGFGFDRNNLTHLGLPLSVKGPNREVFYTNFNNLMTVNRKAAFAFRQDNLHDQWRSSQYNISVQKSERNTYDAIDLDFGHFEDLQGL